MARVITDECLVCGVCMDECAAGAISADGDGYLIDPASCDDCGSCEEICPNDAVTEA
ncbi:MAG: DUF362 domain-containing protein [Thermoleophilia bacterium]